jgi:hypothetical protein
MFQMTRNFMSPPDVVVEPDARRAGTGRRN